MIALEIYIISLPVLAGMASIAYLVVFILFYFHIGRTSNESIINLERRLSWNKGSDVVEFVSTRQREWSSFFRGPRFLAVTLSLTGLALLATLLALVGVFGSGLLMPLGFTLFFWLLWGTTILHILLHWRLVPEYELFLRNVANTEATHVDADSIQ